ncbi:MAG TPA: PAS domain-containing protein [Candidatus Binatia bacterium]|nr:PAS domain-containing protein [Candidatus Binatia bacterium]
MAQMPVELILFRQLATSLAVPVVLVDERSDIIFINEAAERVLGVRLEELDALPYATWTTAFRPRNHDGTQVPADELPLVKAVRDRRPAHGPLVIYGADGVERTIEVTAFPLEGGRGRLLGGVAMFWESEAP